jgi:hypothetical protein
METEKKLKLLQTIYAAALADAVYHFGKAGILQAVTAEKRKTQLLTGKTSAQNFGIMKPEEAFTVLADIFGCADWKITNLENGFEARASRCMLCAIAKKMNAASPCQIYCLNPMEAIVKGLNPELEFKLEETLWDSNNCRVEVK